MKTLQIEQSQIEKLKNLVQKGLECLMEAGEIVVNLIEKGFNYKSISASSGFLTIRDVMDLERIGQGKMNPSLMVFTSPSVKYLREIPVDVQAAVIKNGVEVIVKEGKGFVKKTLTIPELSHRQCKQIFNKGRINSVAAQKRILANFERESAYEKPTWTIEGDELIIFQACRFSKAELKNIIKGMK